MHSCIYEGRVEHQRRGPVKHGFRYRLCALYLDLDELPALTGPGGALVDRRWSWAQFRRSNHLGDKRRPLSEAVRGLIAQRTGIRPAGPIRLLTQLRYFGYYFSPLNLYYCFDPSDSRVDFIVAEVNNTPWGEQHCYVLWAGNRTGDHGRLTFSHDKVFHVSPFMNLEGRYDWRLNAPAAKLYAGISLVRQEQQVFQASMGLRRRELSRSRLRWMLLRFPWMTAGIIVAIYFEALRLWLKRVPFYPHPPRLQQPAAAK